ncbi:translation initiation factor 2 [Streptacidiphilus fuscans]|uniref:Translation initiation factor 2 n=1 Tax=Streptacidiphilus fuscans TaxID=2789292 RepID=A0A931B759_9ACTN|nr:translation initiation factor 2 [Streptacidiphilus fuscans]MBF9072359.1 translation initiation factor 2 [Streptacidiphilus fuscans]
MVPGSEFGADLLRTVEAAGGRILPWEQAVALRYDLIVAASPKGALARLRGPRLLLPHGAGFNKALRNEGTASEPSGLDEVLLTDEDSLPWASVHALAHPDQVERLRRSSESAAAVAVVVGDPTHERILESAGGRSDFREALRTGPRKLVVLTSTWGPYSLLARRPDLAWRLSQALPQDEYQLALVLHPNTHTALGRFEIRRQLAPAIEAGLVIAAPHAEWASLLVASDAVISDHGSTALYAAALGRPVLRAQPLADFSTELLPDSPMDQLLAAAPELIDTHCIPQLLAAPTDFLKSQQRAAESAFVSGVGTLSRLQAQIYRQLHLDPPESAARVPLLPRPAEPPPPSVAWAVRTTRVAPEHGRDERGLVRADVRVERFPAAGLLEVDHLAVEFGRCSETQLRGAGVVFRRRRPDDDAGASSRRTADTWMRWALAELPACRTAAVLLSREHIVLRRRDTGPLLARVRADVREGRVNWVDPSVVLSAVHAWILGARPTLLPDRLQCEVGAGLFTVDVTKAAASDLDTVV